MTISLLPTLPTAPQRTDTPAVFVTRADAWVAALETFNSAMNVSIGQMNSDIETVNTNTLICQNSATAALAASNLQANSWSSATGAATKGQAYDHNGKVWALLVNLADITTSEPSVSNPDWSALSQTELGKLVFTTSGTGFAGDAVAISANDTIEVVSNTAQTESIETPQVIGTEEGQSGQTMLKIKSEGAFVLFYCGNGNDLHCKVGTIEAGGATISWGAEQTLLVGTVYEVFAVEIRDNVIFVLALDSTYQAGLVSIDGSAKTATVDAAGFQAQSNLSTGYSSAYNTAIRAGGLCRLNDNAAAFFSKSDAVTKHSAVAMSESSGTITAGSLVDAGTSTIYNYAGICQHPEREDEFYTFAGNGTSGIDVCRFTNSGNTLTLQDGPTTNDILQSGGLSSPIAAMVDPIRSRIYISTTRGGLWLAAIKIFSATIDVIDAVKLESSGGTALAFGHAKKPKPGESVIGLVHRDSAAAYPYFHQVDVSRSGSLSDANPGGTEIVADAGRSAQFWSAAGDDTECRIVVGYPNLTDTAHEAAMVRPVYDDSNAASFIGFVDSAFTDASTAVVTILGGVDDNQSSLSFGKVYGVQADGSLDYQNPDTWYCEAGMAKSASEIVNMRRSL